MQCENEVLSRASLKGVIQNPRLDLYPEERVGEPLEDVIETMRRRNILIRVDSTDQDRLAFHVRFSYRDPVKAQRTVQALLVRFQDANIHLPAAVNLSVLDPPSLPAKAVFPDRWIFMALGFGAGAVAAVLIAIFRRRTPPMPLPAQAA
jgi:capsular polysaccharide biosynthesis protein